MNQLLQENLLSIIVLLLIIILLLVVVLGGIIIKLLFKTNNQTKDNLISEKKTYATAISTLTENRDLQNESVKEKYFCENHSEIPSVGSCLICEDVFCEKCLIEHESLYFCKEHFKIFANHKWVQITDEKTSPQSPDDGLYIWNFKRKIWREKNIPSFILTHYKINVENDYIESYIQLNVRAIDENRLAKDLLDYKK